MSVASVLHGGDFARRESGCDGLQRLPPPETLQRQFRLSSDGSLGGDPTTDAWSARAFPLHEICNGWRLERHPTLTVTRLSAADGAALGWILGVALDLRAGRPLSETLRLTSFADSPEAMQAAACEDLLDRLHGAFLIVICTPSFARIYPAVTAALGCVFDAAARRVASTPLALLGPAKYEQRIAGGDVQGDLAPLVPNAFDLTSADGVLRLLPNHYLDLISFRTPRFWPVAPLATDLHPVELMDTIRTVGAAALNALPKDRTLLAPLTAGRDSRLILALCQILGAQVSTFTIGCSEAVKPIDPALAPAIAQLAGASHRVVEAAISKPEVERGWIERSGRAFSDSNARLFETMRAFADENYILPGFGGEIARGVLWRPLDRADTPLGAFAALNRINAPITDENLAAADRWIAGVQQLDTFSKLDLLFWEAAHPRGAQIYGPDFVYEDVALLLHPRVLRSMLSLPVGYRRTRRLARDFIDIYRPALNALPFNAYPDWRRGPQMLGKFISPSRVRKYFRIYTA